MLSILEDHAATKAIYDWSMSDTINFEDCFFDETDYWRTDTYRLLFPENQEEYWNLSANQVLDMILTAPKIKRLASKRHIKFVSVFADPHDTNAPRFIQLSLSAALGKMVKKTTIKVVNALLPVALRAVDDPHSDERMNDVLNRAPMHAIHFFLM